MHWHTLTAQDVEMCRDEIADRDHVLASASAREGGRKKLLFNPGTRVYRVKTDSTEATFTAPSAAADHYSAK